ncbi:MbnH family di-heme enzyme [Nannocystaceae bacterium ST9]
MRLARPLALVMLALACVAESEPEPEYAWDLPAGVEPPPTPADNPQTPEKVELGRHLFHDLRLSANQNRACATCHEQAKAFTDGFHRAVGTTNELHGHNTPGLANVGYRTQLGWTTPDARALEVQLLVPLLGSDPIEMGANEVALIEWLADDAMYRELFAAAFPDQPEPIDMTNFARAIAAYERTIISVDSPYDRARRGEAELDAAAQRGLALFESAELGCQRCHGGRDFASPTDESGDVIGEAGYYNVGLYDIDGEGGYPESAQGLITTTGVPSDMGRFRTPTLRNLAYTAPYMHDGSLPTLADVLDVLAAGGRNVKSGPFVGDGRGNQFKSELIHPIELSASEREDLLAFLLALGDEGLISDPAFASPF